MKINLDKALQAVDGKPFKQLSNGKIEDWAPTLKEILFRSVTQATEEDMRSHRSSVEKMKLFKLSVKLASANGVADFELDEVALMKARLEKTVDDIQIFGLVSEMLEGT
jgi:hypothetical protein